MNIGMKSQICTPHVVGRTLKAFVAGLCRVVRCCQWASRDWLSLSGVFAVQGLVFDSPFQASDLLGSLRWDVPEKQGHSNHVLKLIYR